MWYLYSKLSCSIRCPLMLGLIFYVLTFLQFISPYTHTISVIMLKKLLYIFSKLKSSASDFQLLTSVVPLESQF